MKSKRILQGVVAIAGFVPVSAGLAGVLQGPAMLDGDAFLTVSFDSHFRYLSGLLLAIGLAFWSTIRDIESKTERFGTLAFLVVVGGLARIVSLWVSGMPDRSMLFAFGMELIVTPVLAFWQFRLSLRR
jgi:hypothetical protein